MELDGTQQKQLRDALLSAFPKHEHLEMMVSDGMGKYLAAITGSSNLQYAIYELICWAQAQGRLEELILAARKENSRNPKLQSIAQQFGLDKDHKDGLTSDSINSQTDPRDNRSTQKTTSGSTQSPPPSAEPPSPEEYDVFISYRQQDRDWVSKQLVSRLRQTGLTVCVDYDSDPFRPGLPLVRAIERAITSSRKTVLVLSPQYLKGTWTEFEDILVQTIGITTSRPHLIPLLYQPCDESAIPWRIKSLIWLDFTQPVNTESQFQRLVAAIRDEALPIEQNETKKPYQPAFSRRNFKRPLAVGAGLAPARDLVSASCNVIPLGAELPSQPVPSHLPVPKGYRYLGKLDGLPTDHFYREKDGHVALLTTQPWGSLLVDKYAITNQQFCLFINDLLEQKLAYIDDTVTKNIGSCVSNDGQVLVLDAQEYWQSTSTPYKTERPWGMIQRNKQWQPLDECGLLPATHVTWQGAQLYGRWVHNLALNRQSDSCLLTEQQWRWVALYDPETRMECAYPWGEKWQRHIVNYGGYWAKKEILNMDEVQRAWVQEPNTFRRTRPLEVTALAPGRSPLGCLQLIGNVWEWCFDASPVNPAQRIIKGGACNSPQEHCLPSYQALWRPERASEYIGFRCAFTLEGI